MANDDSDGAAILLGLGLVALAGVVALPWLSKR